MGEHQRRVDGEDGMNWEAWNGKKRVVTGKWGKTRGWDSAGKRKTSSVLR